MMVSAIVPTWSEASCIGDLVRALAAEVDEVLVVDAGSEDGTQEMAERAGARVMTAAKGRGGQLDAGARAAQGDYLVFVHADTTILPGFGRAIRKALADPQVVGGNFRLRFMPETPSARLFTLANHLRRKLLRIYYGDSCLFVRRSTYLKVGGFHELPLFEDYAFVRRMEAEGKTHYVPTPEVHSSSRRFAKRPLYTLCLWTVLQVAFSIGIAPRRLARFYADHR